jgi:hypothetical protein
LLERKAASLHEFSGPLTFHTLDKKDASGR